METFSGFIERLYQSGINVPSISVLDILDIAIVAYIIYKIMEITAPITSINMSPAPPAMKNPPIRC